MAAWKATVSGSFCVRRRSSSGVRSAPPPNQALLVTTQRVFMCAAGTCGLCGWAISETPEAQKRGSVSAPGMSLRNSGANSPCTVEQCTPTFSNTRPCIIAMTPPPPGWPVWSVRFHGVRTKRPAGRAASGAWPGSASSSASRPAQMSSRSVSNHARARALRASMSAFIAAILSLRKSPRLPQRLAANERDRHRHIERAQALGDGDAQAHVGGLVHRLRHARAFAPEQQHLIAGIGVVEEGALGLGREQHQGKPFAPPPGVEFAPGAMAQDRHAVEVIHACAAKGTVGDRKAGWLDDMRLDAQAGAQ